MIAAFEKVSGQKLAYEIGPRRAGDVVAVYANNDKAKEIIGWAPKYDLDTMMDSAWRWEQALQAEVSAQLN
jgi:UDP-glucose 4-epimerase